MRVTAHIVSDCVTFLMNSTHNEQKWQSATSHHKLSGLNPLFCVGDQYSPLLQQFQKFLYLLLVLHQDLLCKEDPLSTSTKSDTMNHECCSLKQFTNSFVQPVRWSANKKFCLHNKNKNIAKACINDKADVHLNETSRSALMLVPLGQQHLNYVYPEHTLIMYTEIHSITLEHSHLISIVQCCSFYCRVSCWF